MKPEFDSSVVLSTHEISEKAQSEHAADDGARDCGLLCRGFALLSCEGCQ